MMGTTLALAALLLTAQVVTPPDPRVKKQQAEATQHYRAGLSHLGSERFEKAAEEFRAAIGLDPLLVMAHYGLGQTYMAVKRYPDAIEAYRGCKKAYQDLAALKQSRELETSGRREDTERDMRDMLRELQMQLSQPISQSERERIGRQILDIEGSLDSLRRLKGMGLGESAIPPEFSLALGSALFRGGQVVEAEAEYLEALKINPKYGQVHNNLAVICMMSGRLDEAEEHVKAAEKSGLKVGREFKEELARRRQAQ
jgi:protein O-GlcNAc transferase